ncbi:MAG TPA: HAMP domain-containing sensor histidine kinase [Gaiellaceae bacterium]|nr:HAMP domain-containing sensor histidine kinase [Gaiellaceae bacterium]
MSFRARLTLATALAVAAAIAISAALVYVLVRDQQHDQVRNALRARASDLSRGPLLISPDPRSGKPVLRLPGRGFDSGGIFVQAVSESGQVVSPEFQSVVFPVTSATRAAARGEGGEFYSDATVQGTHVRMLTVPAGGGYALQLLRPVDDVDDLLDRVKWILILVALGGVGAAALLGALVARSALGPVRRLTRETEIVTETRDLGRRIDVHGSDELSRLGSSFNTMLGALDDSQQAQRQLVADASHELRTPLTSLRTNIEVLARGHELSTTQREALLADLVGQLEEMSVLVTDLVEVAAEEPPPLEAVDVQLDAVALDAVTRAQRLAPQVSFRTDLHESVVRGVAGRLERAIANLLDNAVKWSPPGGEIEVAVDGGEIVVRDHGPGIDAADLPHVFDRFYRAPAARALPGSGLGLAIVKQVADEHGGTVAIESANGGGTLVRLTLPQAPSAAVVPE